MVPSATGGEASAPLGRVVRGPDAGAVEFAYVANASSSNISAYSINAKSGALKQISGSPFGAGSGATAVAINPSGKFAYVANSGTTTISAFTVDATSGALTAVT
jgi:6-phosphogluconolactonase (cycloisomerase 2 family)